MTDLGSSTWGTGPVIDCSFAYEKWRSGADQYYNVQITIGALTGGRYFGYPIYAQVYFDGSLKSSLTLKNSSPNTWSNDIVAVTGNQRVANKTTGTVSLEIVLYSGSGSSRRDTYSYTLPIDPAKSTCGATDAYIGSTSIIVINKSSSSFVHSLFAVFDDSAGTTIRIVSKTPNESYAWLVPDMVYDMIPNTNKISCTIICETYDGSNFIGSSECKITISVSSSSAPVIGNIVITDLNPKTVALTGDSSKAIKYFNKMQVSAEVTAQNGATIKSADISWGDGKTAICTIGGESAVSVTENIEYSGFRITCYDSRNLSDMKSRVFQMIEYIKPTLNVSLYRPAPTTGEVKMELSGNYFNGSFGAVNNVLQLRYRFKEGNGEFGAWYDITNFNISENKYTYDAVITGFTYTSNYTFEIQLLDKIYDGSSAELSLVKTDSVMKGIPVFDWGEHDFNFNVIAYYQGKRLLDETDKVERVVLYNNLNGSSGTITLSEGLARFSYVEIYYADNNLLRGGYTKIYPPYDALMTLQLQEPGRDTYLRQSVYTVTNTQLIPDATNSGYALVNINNSCTVSMGTNYIKITRVVGIT